MFLTAFLLLTAQCPEPCERPATQAEQSKVKTAFDDVAFDAPAARWRFSHVRADRNVCGEVNGKNRLGGYTGWTPFLYNLETGYLRIYSDPDDYYLWEVGCLGTFTE